MSGRYRFSDGRTGVCRPVLNGRGIAITFDDGHYTVFPVEHYYLKNATNQ